MGKKKLTRKIDDLEFNIRLRDMELELWTKKYIAMYKRMETIILEQDDEIKRLENV